ncbi:MAG: type II toxin-antitoxin system VapC family toxin [Betaproteobacteria bacterium]|nr:MAG: type II toxin-antitoxin system VapC family toxin [Betaproteobacteria bacterium]
MIGLDTNVLARYYVADTADAESARQREAARRLIDSGAPLAVSKTALLELEWVMRGYYEFDPGRILRALRHLLALPYVEIEDRAAVEAALSHYESGLDFADAMHHAAYRQCRAMATFDDRRFARRAKRMGLTPPVVQPT